MKKGHAFIEVLIALAVFSILSCTLLKSQIFLERQLKPSLASRSPTSGGYSLLEYLIAITLGLLIVGAALLLSQRVLIRSLELHDLMMLHYESVLLELSLRKLTAFSWRSLYHTRQEVEDSFKIWSQGWVAYDAQKGSQASPASTHSFLLFLSVQAPFVLCHREGTLKVRCTSDIAWPPDSLLMLENREILAWTKLLERKSHADGSMSVVLSAAPEGAEEFLLVPVSMLRLNLDDSRYIRQLYQKFQYETFEKSLLFLRFFNVSREIRPHHFCWSAQATFRSDRGLSLDWRRQWCD